MNFLEVVKAMKEGKKVKRGNRPYGDMIRKGWITFVYSNSEKSMTDQSISLDDAEATDWQIVEEKNLKTYRVTIDENNKKIKFDDGREFKLEPIKAKPEEKKTLSDKIALLSDMINQFIKDDNKDKEFISKHIIKVFMGEDILLCKDVKESIKEYIGEIVSKLNLGTFTEREIFQKVAKKHFGERLV